MSRETILTEVDGERVIQENRFSTQSDDQVSFGEWVKLIKQHTDKANTAADEKLFRRQMIRVAALAIAAIESQDRQTGRADCKYLDAFATPVEGAAGPGMESRGKQF